MIRRSVAATVLVGLRPLASRASPAAEGDLPARCAFGARASRGKHAEPWPRVLAAVLLVAVVALVRDAGACSCMPPEATLLSPDRTDDAAANTKIRLEMPSYGGAGTRPILRVHGGANVDVKERKVGGRTIDVVELTPVAPLAADTRYEVATVDSQRHPPTHVLGTFKTAASPTTDTTPPRIDKMGAVFAEKTGQMRTSCSVAGPWVVVHDLAASDPGRASARLVYGVWLGDAAGNIDATKPPTRILASTNGASLFIGQASSCHFHDFPLPTTPFAWLGIAAIDEAGNQSALRKVRVDLQGAKSSP